MKQHLVYAVTALFILTSCFAAEDGSDKANSTATATPTIDSISFAQYQLANQPAQDQPKAPINYSSNPAAKQFKTNIARDYQEKKINFAAYYIVSLWGCGSGCADGVIIDSRDGSIYDLPEVPSGNINQFTPESNLYIRASDVVLDEDDLIEVLYSSWNEASKQFDIIIKRKEPFSEKFYE